MSASGPNSLLPGKEPLPIGHEAKWGPQPFWMILGRETSIPIGNRTTVPGPSSLLPPARVKWTKHKGLYTNTRLCSPLRLSMNDLR